MTLPNLSVLQAKCATLGLEVKQAGKRPAKDDYVQALRNHFMPEGGLKYTEITPMLAFPMWSLKESEQTDVWDGRGWGSQVKYNGCRLEIHFVKDVGVFAHSRTVSVKTFRYEELTSKLLFWDVVPSFDLSLDCEAIIEKTIDTNGYTSGKGERTKSSLHSTVAALHLEATASRRLQEEQDAPLMFYILDYLIVDGVDHRKDPLFTRYKKLERARQLLTQAGVVKYFHFPELVLENRRKHFEDVVAAGGEGTIMKRLASPYIDSSSRSRTGMVKIKRRQEFDCFVSGFVRGEKGTAWQNLVGAIEFSINTDKGVHVLGYAGNITLENRKKISIYDKETDTVTLLSALMGKVAEISGQDISARALRLSHCTIERWRPKQGPDAKQAAECYVKMEDLTTAAEWVS